MEYPHIVCTRVTERVREWLARLASENRLTLSDVLRILLEKMMEKDSRHG